MRSTDCDEGGEVKSGDDSVEADNLGSGGLVGAGTLSSTIILSNCGGFERASASLDVSF